MHVNRHYAHEGPVIVERFRRFREVVFQIEGTTSDLCFCIILT